MAKITVRSKSEGQHPSELIVTIDTISGIETLVIDKRSLEDNTIDIGYPVGGGRERLSCRIA
jgi:hypothetical protein